MGLSTATLAGHRATSARLTIPKWGASYADVVVDGDAVLSGRVDLVIADLIFKGAVLSGGPAKGHADYCVVAGAGGWGKILKKKSYANDAGVKVSTVLRDAAAEAGEAIDLSTVSASDRVGPAFVRPEGRASQVLEQLRPAGWYIGEDGVTRIGARPKTTLPAGVSHGPVDLARGKVTLASDSIAKILPGLSVDGLEVVDVQHELSIASGLRSTVWGSRFGGSSRALESFRRVFEQLDPDRAFRGVYEYRVVSLSGERLNLQPIRVSTGMPDLPRVPVRPGVAGAKSTLMPGTRVVVGFIDADGARPFVLGTEDPDGSGFKPLLTEIDASTFVKLADGVRPMAATGDVAVIFPIVGTTRVLG